MLYNPGSSAVQIAVCYLIRIIIKSFVQLIEREASTNLKHTIIINMVGLEHGHIESKLP